MFALRVNGDKLLWEVSVYIYRCTVNTLICCLPNGLQLLIFKNTPTHSLTLNERLVDKNIQAMRVEHVDKHRLIRYKMAIPKLTMYLETHNLHLYE